MSANSQNPKSPHSVDELVQFVSASVKSHYEKTKRPLTGAVLAHVIKHEYPGLNYSTLGLTRLGDVVRIAVQKGLIERRADVVHLEVLPYLSDTSARPTTNPSSHETHVFVRSDLWRAMVFNAGTTKVFFNKSNSELVEISADNQVGNPAVLADANYVAVESVDREEQLASLRSFLRMQCVSKDYDDIELKKLAHAGLRDLGVDLDKSWKKARSQLVVNQVRRWAVKNGIAEDRVLLAAEPTARKGAKKERSAVSDICIDADKNRKAILAAIADMPSAELEKLAVPLSYVLRYFVAK